MDGFSLILFAVFIVGVVFALALVDIACGDDDEYPSKDEWRRM